MSQWWSTGVGTLPRDRWSDWVVEGKADTHHPLPVLLAVGGAPGLLLGCFLGGAWVGSGGGGRKEAGAGSAPTLTLSHFWPWPSFPRKPSLVPSLHGRGGEYYPSFSSMCPLKLRSSQAEEQKDGII